MSFDSAQMFDLATTAIDQDVRFIVEHQQTRWLPAVVHDGFLSLFQASQILRQNLSVVKQVASIPQDRTGVYIDWAILQAKIEQDQMIPKELFERLKVAPQYNPIFIADLLVFEHCLLKIPEEVRIVLMRLRALYLGIRTVVSPVPDDTLMVVDSGMRQSSRTVLERANTHLPHLQMSMKHTIHSLLLQMRISADDSATTRLSDAITTLIDNEQIELRESPFSLMTWLQNNAQLLKRVVLRSIKPQQGLSEEQRQGYTRVLECNRALEVNPKNVHVLNKRAALFQQLGQYEDALKDLTLSLSLHFEQGKIWRRRGQILQGLGRYQEAYRAYSYALTMCADNPTIWKDRALVLIKLNLPHEALKDYTSALELRPNDPETLHYRGYVHYSLGNYEMAEHDYRLSLRSEPLHVDALYHLAQTLMQRKRYRKAVLYCTRCLELRPDHVETLSARAYAFYELGDYPRSLSDYQKLVRLRTDKGELLHDLAMKLQRYSEAQKTGAVQSAWVPPMDTLTYQAPALLYSASSALVASRHFDRTSTHGVVHKDEFVSVAKRNKYRQSN